MFEMKKKSIKHKLMLINLLTVAVLLALVYSGLVINTFFSFKKSSIDTVTVQAKIIGINSAAALMFNDKKAAQEVLLTLGAVKNTVSAATYKDKALFAAYQRSDDIPLPDASSIQEGYRFSLNYLEITQTIRFMDETIGMIYIRSDLKEMYSRLFIYIGIMAAIMALSLFIAFLLLSQFQKTITAPIFNLAGLTQRISIEKDYSIRVKSQTGDEFDTLAQGLNGMLDQIQSRDIELGENRNRLAGKNEELENELLKRRVAEEELREREEGLRKIFEEGPLGMAIMGVDSKFMRVNAMLASLLGYSYEELIGLSLADMAHPDETNDFMIYAKKIIDNEIPSYNIEKRLVKKGGNIIWVNVTASLIRDQSGQPVYFIGMMKDITERRALYDKLKHDAMHDGLTNLSNKNMFVNRLENVVIRSKREKDYRFAVMFLDLDRFKNVNDSLGHLVGDRLLEAVAERLKKCVRAYNTIARLGGDEFAILLEDITTDQAPVYIAERIKHELLTPFHFDEHNVFVTVSIGIVLSGQEYQNAEEVIRDADIAMYAAKGRDRDCYVIFDESMHHGVRDFLKMENDLRVAIDRNEFVLFYQPIVSIQSGENVGFEALVRWKNASGEIVPPIKFIPVAEETGLIGPIGKWVFQEACRQITQWRRDFCLPTPLTVSINLSSKQMRPDLIGQVEQILQETGADPESLRLEITESILIGNSAMASKFLLELKRLKIKVYLDDFGTGYSSLSYLHKFHIDALKIDRSFVNSMCADENAMEIVKTIISMAHGLKKYVVAEGVETEEQLEELRKMKCDYFQGYLYSKPLDGQTIEAFLKQNLMQLKKTV